MKDINARVIDVKLLNSNVYQVELEVAEQTFIAGQYLMIALPTGEKVPYSIGSAPEALPKLTLYILVSDDASLAFKVVEHLKQNTTVSLLLPGGDAHIGRLTTPMNAPLLLIAGGTGFAQMKSLFDHLVQSNYTSDVHFYWGLRTVDDLFLLDWVQNHGAPSNFHLHLVVNEANASWSGRTGWLYEAILEDHHDLSHSHAFISGSVGMVYGTLDKLEEKGFLEANCYADVFAYAPRPKA